ncbi:MAG: IMP dehydrogenase [Candidatus Diapherotrites archaeon]|uniref:Inosine-5'-monophosphate dehydrogenase n=1 Tax=Candidatus Iainarchaeum sp. TaxID=3101447 RepID=A0A938YTH4_9ARCH|nr:IMP dehydrogenase [Candidatus Diapherotrites archaeon]
MAGKKSVSGNIALAFDDVLLLPGKSGVLPKDANLQTRLSKKVKLNIPLLSAAMDTVTESKTAIAMARQGGLGVIHKNMNAERQAAEVKKVKRSEFLIVKNPICVKPNDSLEKILELKHNTKISSFPVVQEKKLVGIITTRDMLFETDFRKKASEIMTKDIVTVDHEPSVEEAKEILHKHRVEKLPIVDGQGQVAGMVTVTDIRKQEKFPNSAKDKAGRLIAAAAVGPNDDERVERLLSVEADAIVVDTAHGHSKMVLEAVKRYKKKFSAEIIAGNVATAQAVHDLAAAGADAIKVGVGPGAICTTRVISGVGVPQFSAIQECSEAAEKYNIPIIADGGIKYSGDITKALAAGASSVMIGSIFAGCDETPGRSIYLHNRKFKQYRGMGSVGAMQKGSRERYFQDATEASKLVPEGVEGIVPFKGSISEVVFQLLGGLRSGMGLVGAKDIEALRTKTNYLRITEAGLKESHPHDIMITEQSPNYPGQ